MFRQMNFSKFKFTYLLFHRVLFIKALNLIGPTLTRFIFPYKTMILTGTEKNPQQFAKQITYSFYSFLFIVIYLFRLCKYFVGFLVINY